MVKFLLALSTVAVLSLPATDPFTTPGTVSGNWTVNGAGVWTVTITPALSQTAAVLTAMWWNADAFTADQYSEIPNTGAFGGPACRVDSSAITMYGFYTQDTGIYKWVGGSRSSIGSYTGSFSGSDMAKVVCTGTSTTTVEVFKNGVSLGSATDSSSPITSGAAGVFADTNVTFAAGAWTGDDVGASPTTPVAIFGVAPIRCCKGHR